MFKNVERKDLFFFFQDFLLSLEYASKFQCLLPLPKVGKAFNGPLLGILDTGFPVSVLIRLDGSLLGRARRVLGAS